MNQVPTDTLGAPLVEGHIYFLDPIHPRAKYIGLNENGQNLRFESIYDGRLTVIQRTLLFHPERLEGHGGRRKSKSKSKSKKRKTKRKKYVKNKSRRR